MRPGLASPETTVIRRKISSDKVASSRTVAFAAQRQRS
jgi:hypothetical protein